MNKTLNYHNKKIFYRVAGNGKPVVLIHGFGEDGNVWWPPPTPPKEGLANSQPSLFGNTSLTDKFRFIIPDLPGSGKSEMIDDMSIEGLAEVIKEILEAEVPKVPPSGGFRGACIIGHSMGGYITLALVEKYLNHITAFGLFHSSAFADSEEKKTARKKGIDFIREHGAFEFLKSVIPNLFSGYSKQQIPHIIKEFIEQQHNFSDEALVRYYEAMMQRPDRTEQLRKTKVPVLFIMGKYDNAVPLSDGLKQCHLPEKSYIHILQNSGHMGMLEEPGYCTRILEEFLLSTR